MRHVLLSVVGCLILMQELETSNGELHEPSPPLPPQPVPNDGSSSSPIISPFVQGFWLAQSSMPLCDGLSFFPLTSLILSQCRLVDHSQREAQTPHIAPPDAHRSCRHRVIRPHRPQPVTHSRPMASVAYFTSSSIHCGNKTLNCGGR